MKIRALTAVLYFGAKMRCCFMLHSIHPIVVKFGTGGVHSFLLSSCEFRESHTLCVNEFLCVLYGFVVPVS